MTKPKFLPPIRASFAMAVVLAGLLIASFMMPRLAAAAVTLDAGATQLNWPATSIDGATVTLDGSNSVVDDPEAVFTWWLNCTTDPCPGGTELVSNSTDALIADVLLPIGSHNITLWALSEGQWYAAPEITVSVTDAEPVANAGPDQTVAATGDTTDVALDGSASTGAVSYSWMLNATEIGTTATLTHPFPFGVHQVTLTVASAGGQVTSDIVVITVNPTAAAGADQTVDAASSTGANVTLDGAGSIGSAFSWMLGETEIATGVAPAPVELPIGVNEITLNVTGAEGQVVSDQVTVTVNPVAVAGDDQTVESTNGTTAEVTLDGSGSFGDLSSATWTHDEDVIANGVNQTVSLELGTHEITLMVPGPSGLEATDTVTITVELSPDAPAATIDPVRAPVGGTVNFELVRFEPEASISIDIVRDGEVQNIPGSWETDVDGNATGSLVVPETPGGEVLLRFSDGDNQTIADFEVASRIQVTPSTVTAGGVTEVSVTGFGANEDVNIRWNLGGVWTAVGTVTTDENGSGNASITVPAAVASGANSVRGDSDTAAAQTNAVTVVARNVTLSTSRTTVNVSVQYVITGFPANADVTITWRRPGGSTVQVGTTTTDSIGAATGSIRVPATEGGPGSRVIFATAGVGVTLPFEVAPRIKVIPAEVSEGQTVEVSLRGYGKGETVRIRWLVDGVWVEIATVTTSNTGSANLTVTVPDDVDVGPTSVRGDGPLFRAQTNAVTVVPED